MGKRSDFERVERDFYPTPWSAVKPVLPFVWGKFTEPCAGNGALVDHLVKAGLACEMASDIEPQREDIKKKDALSVFSTPVTQFITNPPWQRELLHPMIDHFMRVAPTWLLFDADWMHNVKSAPFLKYCVKIVSIGRVKWFPDTDNTGMDNCCWYHFDATNEQKTVFVGRPDVAVKQIEMF